MSDYSAPCTILVPGANLQVIPKVKHEPPENFVDPNTYCYRLVDGKTRLRGIILGQRSGIWPFDPRKLSCFEVKQKGEEDMRYDWTVLWPQAKAMMDAGKTKREVASELKIEKSALYSKMYREGYKEPTKTDPEQPDNFDQEFDAAMTKQEVPEPETAPPKAATINEDFEKAFPPLGPAEEIKPISAGFAEEIPREIEQLSQYQSSDNDFQDEQYPYPVVELKKPGANLGPIKIQLVATLLAEYQDGMIDADITLGLTRGILDLQLPEVI